MKKTYTKPDIMFDSFSMCTSIASTCEVEAAFQQNVCGVQMGENQTLFVTGLDSVCSWLVEDGSAEFNFLCYHVPSDNYNVFGS